MDLLEVGKIVNTHGLRGEVKVVPWTDYPEVFEDIDFVYVKKKSEYERLDVKGIKYQKNNLIVRFSQITDINMAEKYKNQVIYAEREILGELPEGVYYIADLIGLDIVGFDLVEVAPNYDAGGITSILASRIVKEFITCVACKKAGIKEYAKKGMIENV